MFLLHIINHTFHKFIPGPVAFLSALLLTHYHPFSSSVPLLDEGAKLFFIPPSFMAVLSCFDRSSLTMECFHDRICDKSNPLVNLFRGLYGLWKET